jgi:hypothetical protein
MVLSAVIKKIIMKNTIRNSNSPQYNKHKSSPENKDNLDARKNEEYTSKGDDITHTRKDRHNNGQGGKKKTGK